MENKKIYSKNFFVNLFFYYINKLINFGRFKDFSYDNLPKIEPNLNFYSQKKNFLDYLKKNKNRSLKKNICLYIFSKWIFLWLGFLIVQLLNSFVIIIVKRFIDSFQINFNIKYTIIYGSIIYILIFFRPFFAQNALLFGFKASSSIFSIFSIIISNKLIRLSNKSKEKINLGNITSYLTVDIQRVSFCILTSNQIISTPILFIIYTIILSLEIGIYSLITPAIIMIFIFIIYLFILPINNYSKKKLYYGDKRGKLISESIAGIKIIKMNGWENIINKKINIIRNLEKKLILIINFIKEFQDGILNILPTFIGFIVISIYIFNEGNLTPGGIFYLILIFNFFSTPLKILFLSLINLFEANISLNRLSDFYNLEEIDEKDLIKYDKEFQNSNICDNLIDGEISIKGNFGYFINNININNNNENKINIIKNIDLKIKKGEFVGIIGKVGSGKSSILKIITNELVPMNENSNCLFKGNLSYVPQESFLINDTLRNNILFGNEYIEDKYEKVLKICQLEDDIKILPGKDLTEIGERGINLSGGQKQRVSIARSVYNDSDIYIIDDALSALDADVGQKIFNDVFIQNLKNNKKTIIMATHAIQYINKMDRIIILNNGEIKNEGKFDDLIKNDEDFKLFIETHINIKKNKNNSKKIEKKNIKININENDEIEKGKIIKIEKSHQGLISFDIIKKYIKYGGNCKFIFIILLHLMFIALKLFSDFWISAWSSNLFGLTNNQYFLYYSIILIILILIRLLNSFLFGYFSSEVSINIFSDLINKILKKKTFFFDITPIGQILNLTNKDTDFIDINVSPFLGNFLYLGINLIGTIIFISTTNIVIIPIFTLGLFLMIYNSLKYLKVSIKLRRLSQLVYSPKISIISEFINGFTSFKIYNKIEYQKKKFEIISDKLIRILHLENLTRTWINFRLELTISSIIWFLIIFIIVGFYLELVFVVNNIEIIGLSLSYSILITTYIHIFLLFSSETLKGLSSAERIILNVNNENLEDKWNIKNSKEDWLEKNNNFVIKNLDVKYRENLPLVLKNLNFSINNNEKIGLVGRTGSGKSSFILALMRMLENKGNIEIDGININNLGLHNWRRNLKLIPQDPFIIEGSLKENIDPLNEHKEDEIRKALEKIFENDLNKFKIDDNGNEIDYWDYKILSKGKNLSHGEKQLICISRIWVGEHKILLMDEATSNIDFELDKKIQDLIKNEFKNSVIITIAHRLNTIINYDKIIFFKEGEIKEIGSPKELLNNKNGFFYNLIKENGDEFLNKMIELSY